MQSFVMHQQSLFKAFLVHILGVGQQLEHSVASLQVQEGRDRTELQVKIQNADLGVVLFGQRCQLPREVTAGAAPQA